MARTGGGERVLWPGAAQDAWFRQLGQSCLGAPGGWRAVGLCDWPTRRRRSGRRRRPEACVCAQAQRPPGDLPRGCTRVHTRWVTARGSPGVPRVLPGGEEARVPAPTRLGFPPYHPDAPPSSPRAGCDFSPDQGNKKRAAGGGSSTPFPARRPQETGSCSPRLCPSLFEYPGEGRRLPEQGAPGAPWGVTPGKANGAFRAQENFVLPPGYGKCQ